LYKVRYLSYPDLAAKVLPDDVGIDGVLYKKVYYRTAWGLRGFCIRLNILYDRIWLQKYYRTALELRGFCIRESITRQRGDCRGFV